MRIPAVLGQPPLIDLKGTPTASRWIGRIVGAAGLAGGVVDVASALTECQAVDHRELVVGPADFSSDVDDVRALWGEAQRGEGGGGWDGRRRGGRRRGRCGGDGCGGGGGNGWCWCLGECDPAGR